MELSQTGPRRILIVTADMGGGHNATARALEEQCAALWPDAQVRWVDTLDAMGPGVGPLFRRIYVVNVQSTPWLYEFFYASLVRWHWFAASSKHVVGAWCGRRLQTVLNDFVPDLILSVYPLGSAGLGWLRRHRGLRTPVGAWVSDFAPHPFWVYRDLDLHLVMHEAAVPVALRAEPRARVEVCAPPVTTNFSPGDQGLARKRLDLSPDGFVALVSTGAYGFGDVDAGVSALLAADPGVSVVVVCGRNAALRQRLLARGLPPERLRPLGWVSDMPEWLRAADVVVTNAGGATSLEALASGVPVVMFDPIAAHGRANAELMASSGLALLCPTGADLTAAVTNLVAEPERRRAMVVAIGRHLVGHDLDSALRRLASLRQDTVGTIGPATSYWQPAEQRVRAGDAFFLHVETPDVAQQVGTVLLLDPVDGRAPAAETVRALLAERVEKLPTLRKVLVPRGRWRRPRWGVAAHVDLDEHLSFRAVTDATGLSAAVDDFVSTPLRRDRPLWAVQLVTGLESGRSAVLIKLHHSLGDGIAVIETIGGMLDAPSAPAAAAPVAPPLHGRRPGSALGLAASVPAGIWRLARAGKAGAAPANSPLPGPRRHLVLSVLPAPQVRRTAHQLHVRSTDLSLSLVAGAVHRLLVAHGEDSQGLHLRAIVPVSLRRDPFSRGWGNWTGAGRVDLPIGAMPELERLRRVRQQVSAGTSGGQPEAAQLVVRLIGLLPHPLQGPLARRVYCADFFNVIVSYVPGRARTHHFAGARVAHAYPVLPLAERVGWSIGVMPWSGELSFSVTVDPSVVADADELGPAIGEVFAVLHSECGRTDAVAEEKEEEWFGV
ncbi:MAG: wax ester/triacylglycerol synthase domain-containing protein [Mycobacteriaceae bacterium]